MFKILLIEICRESKLLELFQDIRTTFYADIVYHSLDILSTNSIINEVYLYRNQKWEKRSNFFKTCKDFIFNRRRYFSLFYSKQAR